MIAVLDTFLWIAIVLAVVMGFMLCVYMPYKAIQKIREQNRERKALKQQSASEETD